MSEFAPQKTKNKFPKSRRLLRHTDFERVYKQGRRHFAADMTVFYLLRAHEGATDTTGGPRVGFTVGKVLGGAVQRNRIKRRLREAVRLNGFAPESAVDVVINPKRSLLTTDFAELQNEVAKAFQVIQKALSQKTQDRR
jgi:ribonuclease P protein component